MDYYLKSGIFSIPIARSTLQPSLANASQPNWHYYSGSEKQTHCNRNSSICDACASRDYGINLSS